MKLIINLSEEQLATLQSVLNRPETVQLGQAFKDAEFQSKVREHMKQKNEERKVRLTKVNV